MKVKVLILTCFMAVSVFIYQKFIINVTPSEPLGFYKIDRLRKASLIHRGDIVAVCLPAKWRDIGLKHHYLIPGLRCKNSAPLLKTVIAIPGDTVVLKNDSIIVNGRYLPYSTQMNDSKGRKLVSFPRGFYNAVNTYWLIGVSDLNSWDSRYWGGVERKNILFKVVHYHFF